MGDFHQNGVITTLHNFSQRSLEDLERELCGYSSARPMALVIPSLYSELEGPAIGRILDELCQVSWLDQIVIGLDQADEAQYRHALEFFGRLPQDHVVLWQDGERLRALDARLADIGLAPREPGKG